MLAFFGASRIAQGDLIVLIGVAGVAALILAWITDLLLGRLAFGVVGNTILALLCAALAMGLHNTFLGPVRAVAATNLSIIALGGAVFGLIVLAIVKRLTL